MAVTPVTLVNGGTVDLTSCVNRESEFTIDVRYMGSGKLDPRYEAAFEAAAERWSKVVVGDVPDFPAGQTEDWFGGFFEGRPFNGAVDDVVIGYDIMPTIDGPGGQLGGAGPVMLRAGGFMGRRPSSTISGIMFFDGEDLDAMPVSDVKTIVLHEMGHVLGLVGTTTARCSAACNPTTPARQAPYVCPRAGAEYGTVSGGTNGGLTLENGGGAGTACGHWEEDSFLTDTSSEIMTGFFEADLWQPLSSVTVAGLQDLGYVVDYCGADVWPADENTVKRFDILKTSMTMTMDESSMADLFPMGGVDVVTGETMDWDDMDTTFPTTSDGSSSSSESDESSSSESNLLSSARLARTISIVTLGSIICLATQLLL